MAAAKGNTMTGVKYGGKVGVTAKGLVRTLGGGAGKKRKKRVALTRTARSKKDQSQA